MTENTLPTNLNLFEYTQIPDFEHWEKGINANHEYDAAMKVIRTCRIIRPITMWVLIFGGLYLIASDNSDVGFWLVIVGLLLIKRLIVGRVLNTAENRAESKLFDTQSEHAELCADQVGKKLMIGHWYWFQAGREELVYSDQTFAYLNAKDGTLAAYNNSDIKEVTRERVHTGTSVASNSNTVGGGTAIGHTGLVIGGGKTRTNSQATEYYEWHFDILTDFTAYPKISFVVADSPNNEDSIGKVYAILKP